jgi:hypothetical protein
MRAQHRAVAGLEPMRRIDAQLPPDKRITEKGVLSRYLKTIVV